MLGISVGQSGDWEKAAGILGTAPIKLRVAIDRAVLQEAEFFRNKVVEGIKEQAPGGIAFKPLAETTLAIRRFLGFKGTKALIVGGDLRNSIKVVKQQTPLGAEAFIGVNRSAKGKNGQDMVNVARVHEFGSNPIVIKVTPAMRRFLMAAFTRELPGGGKGSGGGGISRGIIIVRVPARPFLRPVAEKWFNGQEAAERFQARVAENLGGMFGLLGAPGGGPRSEAAAIARAARIKKAALGPPGRDPLTGRFKRGK